MESKKKDTDKHQSLSMPTGDKPESSQKFSPEQLLHLIVRKRWYLLIPFCLCLMAGIVYSTQLTRIYKAETLILVEPQRLPDDYIRSVVPGDIESRVSTIKQQILSRTNLSKIIKDLNLFSTPADSKIFLEEKISSLRSRILVEVTRSRRRGTDSFTISFKDANPETAMKVTNAIATSFIDENLKVREEQAIGTSNFLAGELEGMRARLEAKEEQLQNFRKMNMGELPEQLNTNLRILDRLQTQLSEQQVNLREERNNLQTIEEEIFSLTSSGSSGSLTALKSELVNEIAEHRKILEALQAKYTQEHPDVLREKQMIAEKEREYASLDESNAVQTTVNPMVANNLNELKIRQRSTKQSIKAIANEIQNLQKQMADYETRVENTPKREQELLSLRRDYENMQELYNSLLNRRLEAELAANMERKQKGEQFRIVDPASLPQRPSDPDMKKVFLMFVAAGLGIGGGLIFLQQLLDNSLTSLEEIESVSQLKVVATIPPILNDRDKRINKWNWVFSLGCLSFSILLLGTFALFTIKGVDGAKILHSARLLLGGA
jgi:polysaccharide chain length determinant protein (PEP-CTERM system associated)